MKASASDWKRSVPAGMRALPQWIAWQGKTKTPKRLADAKGAKVNHPPDWSPWEVAAAFYERTQRTEHSGVGFVFRKGCGLVFIDIDHCLDTEQRVMPWARSIVELFAGKTYVEVSPSGRGLHVFLVGALPPEAAGITGKRLKVGEGAVEIYHDRRFSTVTGVVFDGSKNLTGAQVQLDALIKQCGFKFGQKDDGDQGEDDTVESRILAEKALAALDPDVTYEKWVKVGMALKAGFGDDGLVLWDAWSKRGRKYQAGETLEKWRSFGGDGVGLGSLFYIAEEESGFTTRTSAQEDFKEFVNGGVDEVAPSDKYEVGNPNEWKELGLNVYVAGTGKNQEVKCAEGKVNVGIYLRNHPRWKGQLRYNTRFERVELLDGSAVDQHDVAAHVEFYMKWHRSPNSGAVFEAVTAISKENSYDPVVEFLKTIEWDGALRIDGLCRVLGLEDTDVTRRCLRRWMIGAVARAYRPGCEMQNMLVLCGAQGMRKGQVFKRLAVRPEWFSESEVDMRAKDGQLALLGPWIVENGELSGMSKTDVDRVKGFISENISRFRKPYGREVEPHPRRCVLGGSTNETEFLRDATGSRRFWLIEALGDKVLNVELLTAEYVEQLWGEARAAYEAGERWWDQSAELVELQDLNQQHYEGTALDDYVAAVLNELRSVHVATMGEVQVRLAEKFGPSANRRSREVGASMRRAGWELVRLRVVGSVQPHRLWKAPGAPKDALQSAAAVALARTSASEFSVLEGEEG